MKNLLFLILVTGCYNSPKVTSHDNEKTETVAAVDTPTLNKTHKTIDTNLNEALLNPEKVISLSLYPNSLDDGEKTSHLPAELGKLSNLKVLEIHCIDNLEDLPEEIGNLKALETLNLDEGNGCVMNVAIPSSIGQLSNLKVLNLDGALDYSTMMHLDSGQVSNVQLKMKELPQTIANLQNLEVLDLGRNGLKEIPPQVFKLHKLRILKLDYNDISVIPSSISDLTNLEELSISLTVATVKLPESMKAFKGLKVDLAYETLDDPSKKELAEQKKLQEEFPNIIFSYSEMDD
jgi:Leucine-rich repeat (LRR) protein